MNYLRLFPSRLLSLISSFQHLLAFHSPPLTCWTSWQRQQGFVSLQKQYYTVNKIVYPKKQKISFMSNKKMVAISCFRSQGRLTLSGEITPLWKFYDAKVHQSGHQNYGHIKGIKAQWNIAPTLKTPYFVMVIPISQSPFETLQQNWGFMQFLVN